ncbi:alpha-galactosidase [Aestuariibaculum suncheonense]|uniref:Alpha-galactosidase n=1 Tax=Aestuariibaculum suncheonense TaxID=1028745 RepID=A0A8J6UJ08_9FLAO|nr:alpha-galactosidase [Aestuariibaculum suncheonense]MBD0834406.1 alpha-galactosidase [Aestuariibaculum suncheonense]
MKTKNLLPFLFLALLLLSFSKKNEHVIENDYIGRNLSVKDGHLITTKIVNKLNGSTLIPTLVDEFKLRISKGTDIPEGDITLTTSDFKVISSKSFKTAQTQHLVFKLKNKKHKLELKLHYSLSDKAHYIRKQLSIISNQALTLERIDVESVTSNGAYQPYQQEAITSQAHANWKPGLGQPLYDKTSATFWGIEFPAATNKVTNNTLNCGYLWGNKILPKQTFTSYNAVCGVADDYSFIDDAFYNYIEDIRIRPLRLQVQYNSWFDYLTKVNKENFKSSVEKIHTELVDKRGVTPLNAYVIDDGWQDSRRPESDWGDELWKINDKFTPDFKETLNRVDSLQSTLGLWLSPGCFFGARNMVKKLGNQGYESLQLSMSMTGEKYMQKLEDRVLELTRKGISYYKFDGLFGHLNIRDFELNGRGTPAMPQLGLENVKANDSLLNDAKYNELKTYYLVNGTERLITIFNKMAEINPEVFIAITNGAYLSPWWLQYIDVVWMINAGDASKGSSRTEELTYRDGVYYEIFKTEHTKFPMQAIFNHEPKKTKTGESIDSFKDYLFMNMSRGTGFIELYIKPDVLSETDWDVLSEGLKWSENVFPTFNHVKMHGGDPRKNKTYGFTAWNKEQGYISFHNPSEETSIYAIKLDRKLGLSNQKDSFWLSSPLEDNLEGLKSQYSFGDTLEIILKPKEIRILNFNTTPVDWNKILN